MITLQNDHELIPRITRQVYNQFQEPVEQFFGLFPQVKKGN